MTIFIFAGEPSGDLHGSHLAGALKKQLNYKIEGVAGPLMRKSGVHTFMEMEEFAVMGFTDVFLSLPSLIRKFYKVLGYILTLNPKAVILIDYPGFNLRLASHLRKKGYQGKIIQYICPTVWAWGKKRIEIMSQTLDLLLTIYPFEKNYFSHTSLAVEYVGHPITKTVQQHTYAPFHVDKKNELVALFPGSRKAEIKRNFPKILQALHLFKQKVPNVIFGISIASETTKNLLEEILSTSQIKEKDYFFISKERTYELMQQCKTAIAKSGTVTLELALHEKPTVVVYELSFLNRFIAKYIMRLKLPFYCIVNILSKNQVFPELIEHGFTAENLSLQTVDMHTNSHKRESCIEKLKKCKSLLENGNPIENAASSIARLIHENS